MFDARKLLDQLVGSGAAGGFAGGLAGGALGSMLAGKKGKKLAGNALKVGGLALVGGLAYKAWQSYQQGAAAPGAGGIQVPPAGGAFLPDAGDAQATGSLSLLLARAMIAAAAMLGTAVAAALFSGAGGVAFWAIVVLGGGVRRPAGRRRAQRQHGVAGAQPGSLFQQQGSSGIHPTVDTPQFPLAAGHDHFRPVVEVLTVPFGRQRGEAGALEGL